MRKLIYIISVYILLALFLTVKANPYTYKLVKVVDGDTVIVQVDWLPVELGTKLSIRVIGIDTPEKGVQAKCEKEKLKGIAATEYTKNFLNGAKTVDVTISNWDKYGGRIDGKVSYKGKDLGQALIDVGLARPYNGGKKSDWCV